MVVQATLGLGASHPPSRASHLEATHFGEQADATCSTVSTTQRSPPGPDVRPTGSLQSPSYRPVCAAKDEGGSRKENDEVDGDVPVVWPRTHKRRRTGARSSGGGRRRTLQRELACAGVTNSQCNDHKSIISIVDGYSGGDVEEENRATETEHACAAEPDLKRQKLGGLTGGVERRRDWSARGRGHRAAPAVDGSGYEAREPGLAGSPSGPSLMSDVQLVPQNEPTRDPVHVAAEEDAEVRVALPVARALCCQSRVVVGCCCRPLWAPARCQWREIEVLRSFVILFKHVYFDFKNTRIIFLLKIYSNFYNDISLKFICVLQDLSLQHST